MSQLDDFRYLCHIFFNGIIPVKRGLYRYNDKKYKKQEFYKYFKSEFDKLIFKESKGEVISKTLQEPNYKECKVLNKINKIYQNNNCFDYIILGSYADGTATAESDVDDIVFIKKETFETYENFWKTKKILDKLNHYYQQVDPVQHHGHWIFTEFDITNYNQSVMPIVVLNDAVSVGRRLELEFIVDKEASQEGFIKIFDINLNDAYRWTNEIFDNKANIYTIKLMISVISLLLPLLEQIKGNIIDKKTAIEKADKILDKEALKVLKWSTKTRKNWYDIPGCRYNYNKLRCLSLIQNNRIKLQEYSRLNFSAVQYKQLPYLSDLSKESFMYYFNYLENLRNEAVKGSEKTGY